MLSGGGAECSRHRPFACLSFLSPSLYISLPLATLCEMINIAPRGCKLESSFPKRLFFEDKGVEFASGHRLHSSRSRRLCSQLPGHDAAPAVHEKYRDKIPSSGKLSADLKTFSEFFKLRSYEASSDAKFSIDTLANLLQVALLGRNDTCSGAINHVLSCLIYMFVCFFFFK